MRELPSKRISLAVWASMVMLVLTLLSLPAFLAGRGSGNWFVWDYLAIYSPSLAWVALGALGIGHQSLSHVVELFALVVLMPALVSARVFASGHIPLAPSTASAVILVFGLAIAVLLRFAMPHLPE